MSTFKPEQRWSESKVPAEQTSTSPTQPVQPNDNQDLRTFKYSVVGVGVCVGVRVLACLRNWVEIPFASLFCGSLIVVVGKLGRQSDT